MPRGSVFVGERIAVELIVPEHIIERAVVHLIESGAQRIGGGVADASAALLQGVIRAAGKHKLLAEVFISLHRAAKRTRSLRAAAIRKRFRVELEPKPPTPRMGG